MIGVIKSEFLKIKYNKWLHLTSLFCLLCVPVFLMTLNQASGSEGVEFVMKQIVESFYQLQTGYIILASLYYGQELNKSVLRTSLISTPDRGNHLFSKLVSLFIYGSLLFLLVVLVSLLVIKSFFGLSLTSLVENSLISRLVMMWFASVSVSMISLLMSVITNSAVISMSVLVSMVVGLGQVLMQMGSIFKYSPILAVTDAYYIQPTNYYLDLKTGILVQFLWLVALSFLAYYRLDKKLVK